MTMHNPPHPGEFIRELYLEPFGISPEMALRLSRVLGRTPESWLAMQDMYDLCVARSTVNLDGIHPLDFDAA